MRPGRILFGLLVLAGIAAAGFWAGRVVTQPPEDPTLDTAEPLEYVVSTDTVGRTLSFTAIGEWELTPLGRNSAQGVVTTVETSPTDQVSAGDVLYSVDLRPVVVAEGSVPMFRNLGLRAKGPDVAQLQTLLTSLGFYGGEADGSFGSSTRNAVRDWQDSLGVDDTGTVSDGDIVFVPELPATVVLSDDVKVGARLSGGEEVVLLVPEDPTFRIPLAPEQASLVPLTADVSIVFAAGEWQAIIDRAVETEFGQLDLVLAPSTGTSICGNECPEWVDLNGPTSFRANIVVIPETTGPAVPVAAISTDAGNRAFVTLSNGSLQEVTVVESANGLAVIDGIEPGTTILIPPDQ